MQSQKPKNFLAFSSRLLPPPSAEIFKEQSDYKNGNALGNPRCHREAEKEMERKFLVLLRCSHIHIVL